eukprot:GFUD01009275.1.p1 GENE.GFUD01009275.1~~GFUD01009275.1.p1  ORF type:complete len:328 (+),score=121.21 GFUD01009275.1:39-1022(+)
MAENTKDSKPEFSSAKDQQSNGNDKPHSLPYSSSNSPNQDCLLLEPYSHILTMPGKNIRGKLIAGFNMWMNVAQEKIEAIEEIVQMLHNASLLIDDIEDSSILRRGLPVAHLIYGQASTINCSNYVMFIGLEKTLALGHPDAVTVFTQQLLELHRGQGMEIYWRDNFTCPTEEEYKLMISRKTGGLFNLAVRLMQLFSDSDENFTELTRLLGLYFQIRDDYANLKLEDYAANKSFAEDLTEGKFSFPILHTIKTNPRDDRVVKILRQRTQDVEVKKFCISLIEAAGSFEYTKGVMKDLDRAICSEVERLGGNMVISRVMEELRNWDK